MSVPLAGGSTGNALFRPSLHDVSTARGPHGSRSKVHLGDLTEFGLPGEHPTSRAARVVARAEANTAPNGGEFQPSVGAEKGGESAETTTGEKPLGWVPMHDFCLTLPWGLFVALGGLAGFAIAGSTKSLIFGGGMGTLLMALGAMSLKKWKANGSSFVETAMSLLISVALMAVMGRKWMAGGSFIPAGLIACGALFMNVFYAHNMMTGGNPTREHSSDGSKDD